MILSPWTPIGGPPGPEGVGAIARPPVVMVSSARVGCVLARTTAHVAAAAHHVITSRSRMVPLPFKVVWSSVAAVERVHGARKPRSGATKAQPSDDDSSA